MANASQVQSGSGLFHVEDFLSSTEPRNYSSRIIPAATIAIAIHQLQFRKGEWHLQAPQLIAGYLSAFPLTLGLELAIGASGLVQSLYACIIIMTSFTGSLCLSIVVYRLYFHRLGHFPGPRMAAVSKLWHMGHTLSSQNHLLMERLHKHYGDFVRTGPNEITIFHPEVLFKLDGPGSKTEKSVWYDFLQPEMGVTTLRDKKLHDQRRRLWTPALSGKELEHHEDRMAAHARELERHISKAADSGVAVDFRAYAYWFAFDVMGMFAFSQSFGMLEREEWHYAVRMLRRAMSILGPLSPVPWLAHIGFKYTKGYWRVKDFRIMVDWCRDRMMEKIRATEEKHNIAAFLIDDSRKRNTIEQDMHFLVGDAVVAIAAGSDTVAPTLVFALYELAQHPGQAQKLHDELATIDNIHDHPVLAALPHLNAFITEVLRFHPAVPTGGYRDTPAEGMMIGERYIPGGTTVVAPRYVLARLESCYERANDFFPERWTTRPDMVRDKRSFLPFAQGRYTCMGRAMALAELRVVISLLVSKYTINFPDGFDVTKVEGDMQDQFTAYPGALELAFGKRIDDE